MPSPALPLTIKATGAVNCTEWAAEHKSILNELLLEEGAILLRGFPIGSAQGFNKMFSEVAGEPMEYKNRTSPRDKVYNNIYTSTSHPSDQVIQMHTENSYSLAYNRIIAFYCLVPPRKGGETPIADERKLLKSLSAATVRQFREKGVMYLRNTIPGIGLNWQTIYQTDDRQTVNAYLDKNKFEYAWLEEDHLRVKWVLPAFQPHPLTGEELWFNHLFFGLKAHYPEEVLEYFADDELPFVTRYGDGSEIESSVINEFKDFYARNAVVFKWEKDDFLLLDNMMFSHGRNAYEGSRTILTAMAQPHPFVR